MEFYLDMKKNEIMSLPGKKDRTGDYCLKWKKQIMERKESRDFLCGIWGVGDNVMKINRGSIVEVKLDRKGGGSWKCNRVNMIKLH
jgi:hypothetical protein